VNESDARPSLTSAELASAIERELRRDLILANGLGGLTVFAFGSLAPGAPAPDDLGRLVLLNGLPLAAFVCVGIPLLLRASRGAGASLIAWFASERGARVEERELALSHPRRLVTISARFWILALLVFPSISATHSPHVAFTDAVVILLGGAICLMILYLLVERTTRPLVARALAGDEPGQIHGPSIAARLITSWALVSGVPLAGVSAMLVAELAGVAVDSVATAGALLLLLCGLAVGAWAMIVAARSVADPISYVRAAMKEVEQGGLKTRVEVDDGSELGQLQARFNRMASGLEERERLRELFGRHVGRDVAEAAMLQDISLGGEERAVSVLFVDLIGSTSIAAQRPASEVVALLNAFFAVIVETVERHGGSINKFEGDGALCVFGAPIERQTHAADALRTARQLISALSQQLALDIGIGVSSGTVVAGNIGAEERFEFTVIGDPVNEAARLCELAKRRPERALASVAALDQAPPQERRQWAIQDQVQLRGRVTPTGIATPRICAAAANRMRDSSSDLALVRTCLFDLIEEIEAESVDAARRVRQNNYSGPSAGHQTGKAAVPPCSAVVPDEGRSTRPL
jgi:adenylate cyclase